MTSTYPEKLVAQAAQTPEMERAREALAAAGEASTESTTWTTSSDTQFVYDAPLAALRDAQVASGRAVLAVAEEMPATRAEIAQVADAIRDLTKTLDSVLGELGSRISALEMTLDHGASELASEASEMSTELAEIGAALRPAECERAEAPVRRWRLWGGGRR